jgi:hypothetical protein
VWGDRGPHGGASDQHAPRLLDARGDRRLALRHSVVGQVHRHAHTYTHRHTERERDAHDHDIVPQLSLFYFLELSDRFRSCILVLRYVYYNVIMAAAGMSLGRTSRSRETTDFQSQWRDRWACNAISASVDDYTAENGATLIVRGSCHAGTRPPPHLNAYRNDENNHVPPGETLN